MPRTVWRRNFRPYRKGIPPLLLPVLVALALSIAFFRFVSAQLRPIIETVSVSRATNLISTLISGTVDECLSEQQMEYSNFITTEMDQNGNIISLSNNPAASSRFKNLVTARIAEELNCVSADGLNVPIGNLTGSIFLTGFGPDIRVKIYTVGEVTAIYTNSFVSAGVNQTLHGVYLEITATVHLLIPGEIIPVTVTDRVCVAETIILGRVPSTYVHLEKGAD